MSRSRKERAPARGFVLYSKLMYYWYKIIKSIYINLYKGRNRISHALQGRLVKPEMVGPHACTQKNSRSADMSKIELDRASKASNVEALQLQNL